MRDMQPRASGKAPRYAVQFSPTTDGRSGVARSSQRGPTLAAAGGACRAVVARVARYTGAVPVPAVARRRFANASMSTKAQGRGSRLLPDSAKAEMASRYGRARKPSELMAARWNNVSRWQATGHRERRIARCRRGTNGVCLRETTGSARSPTCFAASTQRTPNGFIRRSVSSATNSRWRPRYRTGSSLRALTSAVVEQPQRGFHTTGEELIGPVAIRERPGELQGPEHETEQREHVGSRSLDIGRVEPRCDVVHGARQFAGEDLLGCGGAPDDLVNQGCRGAAVGGLVAVLRGQVGADERLDARATGGLGVEAAVLCAQLVGEHVRDEVLLRPEVAVEGTVRQAGIRHHGRDARAVDPILLEPSPGRFENPLARRLFLVLAVAHGEPLPGVDLRSGCVADHSITIVL